MKSHVCEFESKQLLWLVGGPVLIPVLFAVLMQGGVWLGWLPSPRPALDTDRTILIHQAEASRQPQAAEVLFLGDSSCLMNLSARQLSTALGRPVLNLGNLSFLDAAAQAILLREFATANPGRLKAVVLMMHPEALRRPGSEDYQLDALTRFLAGEDQKRAESVAGRVSAALGVEVFKGRILARVLPAPLHGAYGRFYGFSADLEKFMAKNLGSAVDPDVVPLTGSAEYRLSPALEKAARQFKTAVPPGVKLLVALTPVPEKFAGESFRARQSELLRQWSEWLSADALLSDLPATLPDEQFARTTHLRPEAVRVYTEMLAASLRRQLP